MTKLLLIGCGKMGGALLARWQEQSWISESYAIHPSATGEMSDNGKVKHIPNLAALPSHYQPDAIIIGVKPQIFANILPEYRPLIARCKPLILSLMAGVTCESILEITGEASVVRTMPNLPTAIGEGMTGLYAKPEVSARHQELSNKLFTATGEYLWVKTQEKLDALTPLSGSAPAFLFHYLEAQMQAAHALGFNAEEAKKLVYQTTLGSAKLATQSSHSATELRTSVTSKNGATQAGLEVLMAQLPTLIHQTMQACHKRTQELGK